MVYPVYERLDPLNGMGPQLDKHRIDQRDYRLHSGGVRLQGRRRDRRAIEIDRQGLARYHSGRARPVDDATAGFGAGRVAILSCPRDEPRGKRQRSDRFLDPIHPRQLPQSWRRSAAAKASCHVDGVGLECRDRQRGLRRDGLRRAEQRTAGGGNAGSAPTDQARLRDPVVATRIFIVDLFTARGLHASIEGARLPAARQTRPSLPKRTAGWSAAA